MSSLRELMSPERLKRLGVVYACIITRQPGEWYLAEFADGSRLRVLDPDGTDAQSALKLSIEAERSLLSAPLHGTRAYIRGVPFGMAEAFLGGLKRKLPPSVMMSAVFVAVMTIAELKSALTPERGLFAELRQAPNNPSGYTIWLDGYEFPLNG